MTVAAALIAAAGVGFGHAVLPDHWVPLAVVGRTEHYSMARIARLSGLAGVTHVLVSILLGAVVVIVGLQFRSTIEHAQNAIVGGILIATGVGFGLFELRVGDHRHEHHHHHHSEDSTNAHSAPRSLLAVMVPFGAAASPDLTILPVFLAAAAAGVGAAVGALVIFALVTVTTIVGLTLAASAGGYLLRARWLERWGNLFAAAVLLAIGGLVLAGVL